MKNWILSFLFPFIISLFLGISVYLLTIMTDIDDDILNKTKNNAYSMIINDISIKKFDEFGKLKTYIKADKGFQTSNNESYLLYNADIVEYKNNKKYMHTTSPKVTYYPNSKKFILNNEVDDNKKDKNRGKIIIYDNK